MFSKAIDDLKGGIALSHVWFYQAYHEISAKYKRTVLGSLWIVGSMVFMSLAFALVSSALFHQSLSEAMPYVMGGVLAFNLVIAVMGDAPEVYLSNAGMISNHAYPFTYYTFEWVAKIFMVFAHNLVVFEIMLLMLGKAVVPNWTILIALPVVYVNLLTWGSLVSMMSARYRDLRFLLPYLVSVVMFVSPIMYHVNQVSGEKRLIVTLNFIYPFVEMIRSPLLGTTMPLDLWNTAIIVTVLGVLLWGVFFSWFRSRIPFWV